MSRKLCITAVDGQTGFLIAELLLTNPDFTSKIDSIIGLTLHPSSQKCKDVPGREKQVVQLLKKSGADTICLIPPATKEKFEITMELVSAAKKAGVQNVCLISSAGADLATREKQPRLREFIEIENEVLKSKGDPKTDLGHSPVVIRKVVRDEVRMELC
jgi:hypothetical protein